jgi:hypothetical protein
MKTKTARVNSVHSDPNPGGSSEATSDSMTEIAWPELMPGAVLPLISADGYML